MPTSNAKPIPPMDLRQNPHGGYHVYDRSTGEPRRCPVTGDCLALPRHHAERVQDLIDKKCEGK